MVSKNRSSKNKCSNEHPLEMFARLSKKKKKNSRPELITLKNRLDFLNVKKEKMVNENVYGFNTILN